MAISVSPGLSHHLVRLAVSRMLLSMTPGIVVGTLVELASACPTLLVMRAAFGAIQMMSRAAGSTVTYQNALKVGILF